MLGLIGPGLNIGLNLNMSQVQQNLEIRLGQRSRLKQPLIKSFSSILKAQAWLGLEISGSFDLKPAMIFLAPGPRSTNSIQRWEIVIKQFFPFFLPHRCHFILHSF